MGTRFGGRGCLSFVMGKKLYLSIAGVLGVIVMGIKLFIIAFRRNHRGSKIHECSLMPLVPAGPRTIHNHSRPWQDRFEMRRVNFSH